MDQEQKYFFPTELTKVTGSMISNTVSTYIGGSRLQSADISRFLMNHFYKYCVVLSSLCVFRRDMQAIALKILTALTLDDSDALVDRCHNDHRFRL